MEAMKLIKDKRSICHQDGTGEGAFCRNPWKGWDFPAVVSLCPDEELGLQAGTGRDEIPAGGRQVKPQQQQSRRHLKASLFSVTWTIR